MPPRRPRSAISSDSILSESPTPSSRKSRTSPVVIGLIVIALLAALGYAAKTQFFKPSPASEAASTTPDDVKALVAKVSKHILVDESVTPSVAIVSDAEMLRQQRPEFYKDAQNGDRLLLWSDKAVLYSPSKDLILAVLPLNPGDSPTQPAPQPTEPTPAATTTESVPEQAVIEVRNGSGVAGRARDLVTKLKTLGLNAPTAKDATSKTPYPKTLIIKLGTKAFPLTAENLIGLLGGQVVDKSAAPAEAASTADFLIIVGQDYKPE